MTKMKKNLDKSAGNSLISYNEDRGVYLGKMRRFS